MKRLFYSLFIILLGLYCVAVWAQTPVQTKEVISIEGSILTLDDITPQVAVVVQAIAVTADGKDGDITTTLSDESGHYQFTNLKPGLYKVRCHIPDGYVYYGDKASTGKGSILKIEQGKILENINFRFPPIKKGSWRHYTSLNGLAHNTANNIYIDPDGFMWLGTDSGRISRFDGKNFLNFGPEDGLPNESAIYAIYRDIDGVMWFGTFNRGVYRFDSRDMGDSPHFTKFGEGVEGLEDAYIVLSIKRDLSGNLWFGTYNTGLFRYDGKKFDRFTDKEGVNGSIGVIHQAPDGMMWFGTTEAFLRYDGKKFDFFNYEDALVKHSHSFANLANDSKKYIHRSSDGEIWYTTGWSGISGYDGKRYIHLTTNGGLPHNRLVSVQSTSDGAKCFGMWGGGMSCYNNRGNSPYLVNFTVQDGLLSNIIKELYADQDRVIWVASGGSMGYQQRGGLSRYDPHGFVNFTTEDGLPGNSITALYRSPDDALWIGTLNGVSRYDGKNFINFTTKDGLVNDYVTIIKSDRDGIIWFGNGQPIIEGKGISRYDTKTGKFLKPLTTENGLAGNKVYSIYPDPDGVVWLGTNGGLSRYDSKTGKFLEPLGEKEDGLIDRRIYTIQCDPDGMMWFFSFALSSSTEDSDAVYFVRYDGKKFDKFLSSPMTPAKAFYRDQDSTFWSGSRYGIFRYDGNAMISLTQKDGPADTFVHDMYPNIEGGGNGMVPSGEIVWFGTDTKGVTFYDGTAWSSLDTRDGLAGDTVTAISQDADGSMWFGTQEGGLTRYCRTSSKPKAYITSVTTDKTYSDLSAIPEFAVGIRVTIEYNAIDFKTIPEKRQYRVRVIKIPPGPPLTKGGSVDSPLIKGGNAGSDSDWLKPTKSTSFDYIFPDSGTYTFEVQAIDRDLNYSEPVSLPITISPTPFYMTRTFITALSIIGGLAICGFVIIAAQKARLSRSEKLRLQQEMEDARQMQLRLIPETAPEVEGFDIAGFCQPAKEVGGDFFDYLPLSDGKMGIALADISGKGLKAAMNAVLANGMLREISTMETTSGKTLSRLNTDLYPMMEKHMFTAIEFAILEKDSGILHWSNAAQPYPLIRRNGQVFEFKSDGGLPLCMMPEASYSDLNMEMQAGDIIVFYTDGIIEVENRSEEMYGNERLEQAVGSIDRAITAKEIINAILQDVIHFVGDAEQYDDMTIIVVKKL